MLRATGANVGSNVLIQAAANEWKVPVAEVEDPDWVGSLKTEEKTKLVEPACQEDKSCD